MRAFMCVCVGVGSVVGDGLGTFGGGGGGGAGVVDDD